jgi:nicotinamide mononucleotide transporter
MQPLELLGTALGLTNLWLTVRQNIWCWPVGIACVVCFAFVFYDARLYSDLLLQIAYIGLQAYGWARWLQHGRAGVTSTAPVTVLSPTQRGVWAIALAVVAGVLGATMAHFTKADLPYLDAVPTTLSLAAQWLQARKVLDSWILFIVGNLLFIGIYAVKGLYVTIGLYVASSALAVAGFIAWRRAMQQTLPSSATNP